MSSIPPGPQAGAFSFDRPHWRQNAQRGFLDPRRIVQKDLDIAEYTDAVHNPMIPHVIVLEPGLVIYKIYSGYWFFGRPTVEELRQDLRAVSMKCRPDESAMRYSAALMSESAQNPTLPHCNSNGRFTSDNGHYVANLPALPIGLGSYVAATLTPAKGRLMRCTVPGSTPVLE